jgi:hypothetical protein
MCVGCTVNVCGLYTTLYHVPAMPQQIPLVVSCLGLPCGLPLQAMWPPWYQCFFSVYLGLQPSGLLLGTPEAAVCFEGTLGSQYRKGQLA